MSRSTPNSKRSSASPENRRSARPARVRESILRERPDVLADHLDDSLGGRSSPVGDASAQALLERERPDVERHQVADAGRSSDRGHRRAQDRRRATRSAVRSRRPRRGSGRGRSARCRDGASAPRAPGPGELLQLLLPSGGSGVGQLDLPGDPLEQQLEELVLVADVPVEGGRAGPELLADRVASTGRPCPSRSRTRRAASTMRLPGEGSTGAASASRLGAATVARGLGVGGSSALGESRPP